MARDREAGGRFPRIIAAILIACAFSFTLAASDVAEARQYTAGHKFRRGISNLSLGVLAIPGQMTHQTRKRGAATGLPLGFVQGVGWFVVSEMVGVWEFLTCPFEFPPRFEPVIEPEYPWQYFDRRSEGAGLP